MTVYHASAHFLFLILTGNISLFGSSPPISYLFPFSLSHYFILELFLTFLPPNFYSNFYSVLLSLNFSLKTSLSEIISSQCLKILQRKCFCRYYQTKGHRKYYNGGATQDRRRVSENTSRYRQSLVMLYKHGCK